MPVICLILVAGAFAYWKVSHPITNEPVAPDTYIVFGAVRDLTTNVNEPSSCEASVYRYAIGAKRFLKLEQRLLGEECQVPYGFDTVEGYVFLDELVALNLNGKDITTKTNLQVMHGVGGYVNPTTGIGVNSEYIMPENKTYVSFFGTEDAPDGFEFVNTKFISAPYYLAPVMISDDSSQVYFAEYTEAGGSLREGVHLWVYDMVAKTMTQVAYGKDLLFLPYDAFVIDSTHKRLLIVSGTRKVNEEAPGWDEVVGPSQLHLVDLVTGKGVTLGFATTDEEIVYGPQFSPVDANTFAAITGGITHTIIVGEDGLILEGHDIEGQIADWTKDFMVVNGPSGWDVYDPTGKTKLGSAPFADFDLTDGSFWFQYLGSITIQ